MNQHEKEHLFAEQYPRLFRRIYGYLALRITTSADAEDLTSEVFIKAYNKLKLYEETSGTLEQWLMGITKNALIDFFRKRKPTVDLESIAEMPEQSPIHVSDRIDAQSAAAAIAQTLTAEQHLLMTLRHVDGFTHAEIAEILGKSETAVRKAASRLEQHLRTSFPHLVS